MKTDAVKRAVDVLVEEGELLPVRIEGGPGRRISTATRGGRARWRREPS